MSKTFLLWFIPALLGYNFLLNMSILYWLNLKLSLSELHWDFVFVLDVVTFILIYALPRQDIKIRRMFNPVSSRVSISMSATGDLYFPLTIVIQSSMYSEIQARIITMKLQRLLILKAWIPKQTINSDGII